MAALGSCHTPHNADNSSFRFDAKSSNTNGYLGYSEWRLPNINELESLINAGQTDSSSWLNLQGFSNVQGNAYWSSTTDATATGNAWLVFMGGGDKDSAAKGSSGIKAWPVRSGF